MTSATPVQESVSSHSARSTRSGVDGKSRGRGIVIGNGQRSNSTIKLTSPYSPGMFDVLLPIRRADPSAICACSVRLTQSGDSVIVAEQTRGGSNPAHLIAATEYPYFVDLRLADGSEIQIEIRRFEPPIGAGESRVCVLLDGVSE